MDDVPADVRASAELPVQRTDTSIERYFAPCALTMVFYAGLLAFTSIIVYITIPTFKKPLSKHTRC